MVIKAIPPAALSLSDPTTTLQTYLESLSRPLYIIFIASPDPATDAPWCPDVRAALPIFNRVFEESEEELSVVTVQVGDKPACVLPISHTYDRRCADPEDTGGRMRTTCSEENGASPLSPRWENTRSSTSTDNPSSRLGCWSRTTVRMKIN